jgi:hypothetical protein
MQGGCSVLRGKPVLHVTPAHLLHALVALKPHEQPPCNILCSAVSQSSWQLPVGEWQLASDVRRVPQAAGGRLPGRCGCGPMRRLTTTASRRFERRRLRSGRQVLQCAGTWVVHHGRVLDWGWKQLGVGVDVGVLAGGLRGSDGEGDSLTARGTAAHGFREGACMGECGGIGGSWECVWGFNESVQHAAGITLRCGDDPLSDPSTHAREGSRPASVIFAEAAQIHTGGPP